jgi:hypothetical protein
MVVGVGVLKKETAHLWDETSRKASHCGFGLNKTNDFSFPIMAGFARFPAPD